MDSNVIIMILIGVFAGILGSIVGIGGGIIITPVLTLGFGINIKYAIGASIVSVIATSSGASISYLQKNIVNLRVAIFLEIATSLGALIGALLTGIINPVYLYLLFGLLLFFSGINMLKKFITKHYKSKIPQNDFLANKLKLNSFYYDRNFKKNIYYNVYHVPYGFLTMLGAGLASGLLGIGSGAFKVIALDSFMKIPIKPSSATSNLMMGITASISAIIYFFSGNIIPELTVSIALGVTFGAIAGAKIMQLMPGKWIRIIFIPILIYIGLQMFIKGVKM